MRILGFYHSLVSDWNHGNAHFLRGIATELIQRGHEVCIYEAADNWSARHQREELGARAAEAGFREHYPLLRPHTYPAEGLPDLDRLLDGADAVLVHEWNPPELIRAIGEHHQASPDYTLLFHDTHHRAVSAPAEMDALELAGYDGALVFGEVLRRRYLERGWVENAWTWHEAADLRVFRPLPARPIEGDLVWIGNWGDGERSAELHEFLFEPVRQLGLSARVHGVRYPREAREALRDAGIAYGGWLPNYLAPDVFARFRVTVHVPRRFYRETLVGIPTIRPFEAMACGIPLVSAPWDDAERLFTPGEDYLVAEDGEQMARHLHHLLRHPEVAKAFAARARETIRSRHTCAHRVDELIQILDLMRTQRRATTLIS